MTIRYVPFQATHKAVYDILDAKQTTKIYDTVPSDPVFPCISFGPFSSKSNGAKMLDISDISLQIHIWSQDTSKKEIEDLCYEVSAVLTAWELDMGTSGFKVLSQDVESCDIYEEEAIAYHAQLTFTAKIQYIGG